MASSQEVEIDIPINTDTVDNVDDDDSEVVVAESATLLPVQLDFNKKGRSYDESWTLFTDEQEPHKKKCATCKHCDTLVNYYCKVERVKNHLCKCQVFQTSMMSMKEHKRPKWFNNWVATKKGISPVSGSQSSIKSYLVPNLTVPEIKKFKKAIAMHYYLTGTSFQRVEEEHLLKAFRICRPAIALPTRKDLSGYLLDSCYMEVKGKVDEHLAKMTHFSCLTTDGWSNIRNESVINYMVGGGSGKTFFVESVATREQGHTGEFIAADLGRVIDALENKQVNLSGAITDNTSANRLAWAILKARYPGTFFHGCVSHGLHLLVKDVFAATKVKRGREVAAYPDGYPFEYLLDFSVTCKEIVGFFSYHHQMKSKLTSLQREQKKKTLVQPAPTRWGTLKACFESLLQSETILHSIVSARGFVAGNAKQRASRQKVLLAITSPTFISYLKKGIAILEPVDAAIVLFQNDDIPVSVIYHRLNFQMKKHFEEMIALTETERMYLLNLLQSRSDFLYGDAIGIAYLLDPVYIGDDMLDAQREELEMKIFLYSVKTNMTFEESLVEQRSLFQQYTAWILKARKDRTENKFKFQMLKENSKTRIQYWQIDGDGFPIIKKIAMVVFGMMTSSAASERNFSTFSFIHSKLRNSLNIGRVEKLVYIKSNAPMLDTKTEVCSVSDDSDLGSFGSGNNSDDDNQYGNMTFDKDGIQIVENEDEVEQNNEDNFL